MQEESSIAMSRQSQPEQDMCIFEGGCLPPPNRFKKNSNPDPLNQDDARRIQLYKMTSRRETARNEQHDLSESSMYIFRK